MGKCKKMIVLLLLQLLHPLVGYVRLGLKFVNMVGLPSAHSGQTCLPFLKCI